MILHIAVVLAFSREQLVAREHLASRIDDGPMCHAGAHDRGKHGGPTISKGGGLGIYGVAIVEYVCSGPNLGHAVEAVAFKRRWGIPAAHHRVWNCGSVQDAV